MHNAPDDYEQHRKALHLRAQGIEIGLNVRFGEAALYGRVTKMGAEQPRRFARHSTLQPYLPLKALYMP